MGYLVEMGTDVVPSTVVVDGRVVALEVGPLFSSASLHDRFDCRDRRVPTFTQRTRVSKFLVK